MIELSLKPPMVRVGLEAVDRLGLFRALVGDLAARESFGNRQAVFDAVVHREGQRSTAVGEGLAFPHALTDQAPGMLLAAARLARPIEFEAPDREPVDLVFLVLAPPAEAAPFLVLLGRLARVLSRRDVASDLRSAPDEEAFSARLAELMDAFLL